MNAMIRSPYVQTIMHIVVYSNFAWVSLGKKFRMTYTAKNTIDVLIHCHVKLY